MKGRLVIATDATAAVLLASTLVAGAAGSAGDLALFGKDPGTGKAFACYTRRYDPAHLAAHRKQNVRDMTLFVNSYMDTDMGRQYGLEIGVHFRKRAALFQVSGGCSSSTDGKNALSCGVDCDGGHIDVRVKDAKSILVAIPDGARTWDPTSDADHPKDANFGVDDKLFRLDRTDLRTCLPLISDDEVKAEVSATK